MNADDDALESTGHATRVRSGGIHKDHAPQVLLMLDPRHLRVAALAIEAEVRRHQRVGAGSYLYVDTEHRVYVVSELRSVAALWVKERFGWLVALYAPRRKDGRKRNDDGTPFLAATEAGITEDLEQHLSDLSRPQP